jgi:hypothetical protein
LGRLALDCKPDVIVDMGDWADMPSLSSYDKGKKSFEGRRYKDDIEASYIAYSCFEAPMLAYNTKRKKDKKTQYKPRKVKLIGNHEERILRAVNSAAELEGVISLDDLGHKEFGWEHHDYLQPVNIDGVFYSHYFTSGVLGRAISGENPASTMLKKHFVSCTAGHLHLRDFAERTRADGQRIIGLISGCYFEHYEDYAGTANDMWWRGAVLCHDVKDGCYEPEFISMEMIKKKYG